MKKITLTLSALLLMSFTAQAEENALLNLYLPAFVHGKQTPQSANATKTASLHGCWQFDFTIGISPFTTQFCVDRATIKESETEKDVYYIYGTNYLNVPVAGGYYPPKNYYHVMEIYSTTVFYFTFNDFTTPDTVSGCYHLIDNSGYMSWCYPMTGHRIASMDATALQPTAQASSAESASKLMQEKQRAAAQGQQNQVPAEIAESLRSARAALPSQ